MGLPMFRILFVIAVLVMETFPSPLIAKTKSATAATGKSLQFGQEWTSRQGLPVRASMDINWSDDEIDFVRDPVLDEKLSQLNQGSYPLTKRQADERVFVTVKLSIDAFGTPISCETIEASEYPKANGHACPHILKFARFIPPLDFNGTRVATSGKFTVSYDSIPPVITDIAMPGLRPRKREAAPTEEITAKTLGLEKQAEAAKGTSAWLWLDIDESGKPIKCELESGTYVDALDFQLCSQAMSLSYIGALDADGKPVEGHVSINLEF